MVGLCCPCNQIRIRKKSQNNAPDLIRVLVLCTLTPVEICPHIFHDSSSLENWDSPPKKNPSWGHETSQRNKLRCLFWYFKKLKIINWLEKQKHWVTIFSASSLSFASLPLVTFRLLLSQQDKDKATNENRHSTSIFLSSSCWCEVMATLWIRLLWSHTTGLTRWCKQTEFLIRKVLI